MQSCNSDRISDYGLIGNCRTAALVSKQGSLDWCCFPQFDSEAYFARLLDPSGGHFSLGPLGRADCRQSYIPSTNVLETRFTTESGVATLTDCFAVRDTDQPGCELWPDQEILRILEVEKGEIEFSLEFCPRGEYGRHGIGLRWIGNWGIQCNHGRKLLLLQTSLPSEKLKLEDTETGLRVSSTFRLRPGEHAIFSLSYSDEAPAVIPPLGAAFDRLEQSVRYWRKWVTEGHYEGSHARRLERSALVLKLLNFAPSGAFVAAPTTSLPENPGGARNWDYRFCWLRDASFTTRALLSLGYLDEAKAFLGWLLHSTRLTWPRLQVVYSVFGESKLRERVAGWLSGYRGSKPVRVGNEASTQIQLDIYGEVIDSFFSLSEHLHPVDHETRKMVIGFGRAVAELWRKPDQGIWEFRSHPRHFTHSKLMCWVAMDRLARLSNRYGWRLPYDAAKLAGEIRAAIEEYAYDPELRAYTRAFGEPALDASVLVMPLVGYCDANFPRYRDTQKAIIHHLGKNDLIYRYLPGSDGLPEPEGAFTICSFWLSEALARAGRLSEAQKWFEAVIRALPPTGLASEEIDPDTNALLGNHPQGFSHIGLINAANAIHQLQRVNERRSA